MSKPRPLPSLELLHELFFEQDGVLYHRKHVMGQHDYIIKKAGELAGYNRGGYWRIRVEYKDYKRSRLIWKMRHGTDPIGVIHHVNGDTFDDRIENLMDVTQSENMRAKGAYDGSSYVICSATHKRRYRPFGWKIGFGITC